MVSALNFFGVGCCRYDGWSPSNSKHHGYKTIIECQEICYDDASCIACDVARPVGSTSDCYTFHGSGNNFHTECPTLNTDEMCYKKTGKYRYISYKNLTADKYIK